MFQEIAPDVLDTQYLNTPLSDDAYVVTIHQNQLLLVGEGAETRLPTYAEIKATYGQKLATLRYLLAVGDNHFFYLSTELPELGDFSYQSMNALRHTAPKWRAFASVTAGHLAVWYANNQYCGRCGHLYEPGAGERKLVCPNCGQELFPRISPAIIVAVKRNDQILLTKYAKGYDRFALIAGFVEIGETIEETVRREVYEETGLEVTNLQYFKSQPWGFSQSILMGFFADFANGDTYATDDYKSDPDELAVAKWFNRDDIPTDDNNLSLTKTMISAFRSGDIQ